MPTFVKSANNPNGTWQADGMDQAEQANRQYGAQQGALGLQAQLAMAQLKSEDARYGAGLQAQGNALTAQVGLGHDQLGLQRDLAGQNFSFLNSQDQRADAYRNKMFDYSTSIDPTKNPLGAAQAGMYGAQSKMAQFELDRQMKEEARKAQAQTAAVPADNSPVAPDIDAQYKSDLATLTPAEAVARRASSVHQRDTETAGALGDSLGTSAQKFSDKDNATFGWDPTDTERQNLESQFTQALAAYRKIGLPPDAAVAKARSLLIGHIKQSANSGQVDKLLKELNLQ